MTELESRLGKLEARQRAQGEVLAAMEALTTTVHTLSETVSDLQLAVELDPPSEKTTPWANVPWHELRGGGEELTAELHRLRGWLNTAAIPVLGWRVPQCWYHHPLAVVAIDVAMELWRVLWLPEGRTEKIVAAQAEYLIRVMPGLQAVVERALRDCDHPYPAGGAS